MVFQGGEAINSIIGVVFQSALEEMIQKALAGEAAPAPFIVVSRTIKNVMVTLLTFSMSMCNGDGVANLLATLCP